MTVVDIPSGARTAETWLGGRFRLDERINLDDQVSVFSGSCGSAWEARGLSLWKATDQLLNRPVTIYLLPRGPVPSTVTNAVRSAARVSDSRLATIYDNDFDEECPYIVAAWTPDPRRRARHAGRHRLPRPAGTGRRRPTAAADPGWDGYGARHAATAVLPAGTDGERARRPVRQPAAAGAAREGRLPAPHHAAAP